MKPFRLAAAQYPVSEPGSWDEAAAMLTRWVREAASHNAELLVFPEYAAMSLAAIFAPGVRADLRQQLHALQSLRDDYVDLHSRLAAELGVHILAGSFPWQLGPELFHNRAWFVDPEGHSDFQDKRIMTRFEREQWGIAGGEQVPLRVFDTALGVIGVNVCYDVEFPLLARRQTEAGARLILAPSCTDTLAGYHRVRVGAQARALENQCIVVQSPLVGEAPWSAAIDVNVGAAGVYAPPDRGFPDDGVVAQGRLNEPGWVYADIDLNAVDTVRRSGQVFNDRDWAEQGGSVCPDSKR